MDKLRKAYTGYDNADLKTLEAAYVEALATLGVDPHCAAGQQEVLAKYIMQISLATEEDVPEISKRAVPLMEKCDRDVACHYPNCRLKHSATLVSSQAASGVTQQTSTGNKIGSGFHEFLHCQGATAAV